MKKNQLLERVILCSIFLLLSFVCFAQVSEEWVRRYNGPANRIDNITSLVVDASKNVYVTGHSRSVGGFSDYATIKYSGAGVLLWVARYNGPPGGFDDATSVAIDDLGNVYVTGASNGTDTDFGNQDYATIKYNKDGIQQWVARYNGPDNGHDVATSLAVDIDRNVYVTGYSQTASFGYDYVTIKYDKNGLQLWVERYNGPDKSADRAFSLAIDALKNVYVTGLSMGSGTQTDIATIKYSTAGTIRWVARYDNPAHGCDYGMDIVLDGTGANVYVTGSTSPTCAAFSNDYATVKYNAGTGALQWIASYNGPDNRSDDASSLAVDAAGNVYVTGASLGAGSASNYDYATVKYNPAGVQLWATRYNGAGTPISSDRANSLALDGEANVYVTGESTGVGVGALADIVTIKYSTAGTNVWIARYNGPPSGSDGGNSITVDASGKVYVGGYSFGIGTEPDYVTIKYTQTAGKMIEKPAELILQTPSKFSVSNYPNPVSLMARIQYEIPFDGWIAIKVYDVLGREVATLVNANKKAGYYNTDFNVSSFQSGVYYYRAILTARKELYTQSGKLIVEK